MTLLRKIQYSQNWNIGFCKQTPDELIKEGKLRKVHWLKHTYKDRWFADPFIYKVTQDKITVFVEECSMEEPKGILCELVINRKSMRLEERHVLLEADTHLSYPAIFCMNDKTYVYPENGESSNLVIYEYDESCHKLTKPIIILKKAVADATIFLKNKQFYLSCTFFPQTQNNLFLFASDSLFGPYKQFYDSPIQNKKSCSRNGGNVFSVNHNIYRPAQNCNERYGASISIMKIIELQNHYEESLMLNLKPSSYKYNLGLHTINFKDELCVVDSYGYYFPFLGRLYNSKAVQKIIHLIKKNK